MPGKKRNEADDRRLFFVLLLIFGTINSTLAW
jgi:hypothetical protein